MDFKVITSRENSLIKLVSSLQDSRKSRKENGLFVLEGLRICKDAFDNGIQFDKLIVSESAFQKLNNDVLLFTKNSLENYKITDSLFKKISDTKSPQGIIALCSLKNLIKQDIDAKGKYIALENLSDPSNLGAISRTAEALGVSGIILSDDSCDPFSPKALRVSMGTLLRMPLFIFDDFRENLKDCGLKVYACVVDSNAEKINSVKFTEGSVVLIGNEANGIEDETKKICDKLITIPMQGRAESLNAAVASSIAMWEMMK